MPKIFNEPTLTMEERVFLQRELSIKQQAINKAASRGELVWSPDTGNVRISNLQDEYRQAVADRYQSMFGKKLDLTGLNADHPVDLIIGGSATQRLKMLNESINKSVGASLFQAGRRAGLKAGDPIDSVVFIQK